MQGLTIGFVTVSPTSAEFLKGRFSPMNCSELQTVIVCIRNPSHGARILHEAARTAQSYGAQLQILAVQPVEQSDEIKSQFVEDVYRLSREFNAEMHVIFDENPVVTAVQYINSCSHAVLFTGMPGRWSPQFCYTGSSAAAGSHDLDGLGRRNYIPPLSACNPRHTLTKTKKTVPMPH